MPVIVDTRLASIAARADEQAREGVRETREQIAEGAKANLTLNGSIVSGALFDSVHAEEEGDGEYEGLVSAGEGLPDGRAVYIELGTGVRGAGYEFPGKPDGITYDMEWERGIPKEMGFAYMIPALEAEREPFEERMGNVFR